MASSMPASYAAFRAILYRIVELLFFFLPIPPPPKNILQRCIYVLSDHYDFDKDTDRLTLQLCEVYDKLRSFLLALLCGCILRYTPEGPLR